MLEGFLFAAGIFIFFVCYKNFRVVALGAGCIIGIGFPILLGIAAFCQEWWVVLPIALVMECFAIQFVVGVMNAIRTRYAVVNASSANADHIY